MSEISKELRILARRKWLKAYTVFIVASIACMFLIYYEGIVFYSVFICLAIGLEIYLRTEIPSIQCPQCGKPYGISLPLFRITPFRIIDVPYRCINCGNEKS